MPLAKLVAGTRQVLPTALDRSEPGNFRFSDLKWIPMVGTKAIMSSVTCYNPDSVKGYKTLIDFYGIQYAAPSSELDDPGEPEYDPPSFERTGVRVSCSCPAYYFYFAYWNAQKGVQARAPFKKYVHVANPRRKVGPQNPGHIPGLCKHLAAYAELLRDSGYIS